MSIDDDDLLDDRLINHDLPNDKLTDENLTDLVLTDHELIDVKSTDYGSIDDEPINNVPIGDSPIGDNTIGEIPIEDITINPVLNFDQLTDDKVTDDEKAKLDIIYDSIGEQVKAILDKEDEEISDNKSRKRIKKRFVILPFALIILLIFTPLGKKLLIHTIGSYVHKKFNIDSTSTYNKNKDLIKDIIDEEDLDEEIITKPTNTKDNESIVKNILLLGVEEFFGASNTDTIIIASLNPENRTLKLISLMRDLYVEIPGHTNNRLNSVYAKGGINLLYQTIEKNFGVKMDGYILVNFDAFENIVDNLGGIEITLTKSEANYLNRTNYISNPKNRNVVKGKQLMNGNQVLGYCRIRYVSTGTENNDYGRTQRHRIVLNSIFNKVKKLNLLQLTLLMNRTLSEIDITTDISQKEFNTYLEQAVDILDKIEIKEYRVPADGTFRNEEVVIGGRKSEVLVPKDWDSTRKELKDFIEN